MADRAELARRALEGYVHGPDAPVEATARALAKVGDAATLVLVEGISDQIAVETAAAARGRDLEAEGVVVVPIGGAHAIGRFLARRLGLPPAAEVRLAGLCDLRGGGSSGADWPGCPRSRRSSGCTSASTTWRTS